MSDLFLFRFPFFTMSKRLRCSEQLAVANQNSAVITNESASVKSCSRRDSSKIMKKWWKDRRRENAAVLKDKDKVFQAL
jgi:hypothetical protein